VEVMDLQFYQVLLDLLVPDVLRSTIDGIIIIIIDDSSSKLLVFQKS
jgi:hypothetical protein